jgi:hypothetical protein
MRACTLNWGVWVWAGAAWSCEEEDAAGAGLLLEL